MPSWVLLPLGSIVAGLLVTAVLCRRVARESRLLNESAGSLRDLGSAIEHLRRDADSLVLDPSQ